MVTFVNKEDAKPTVKLYDPSGSVTGIDINTSLEIANPSILSIEGLVSGTTVNIQGKLHYSAVWQSIQVVDGAVHTKIIITLSNNRLNFVRTVRTGLADFIVYTQL